MFVLAACGSVPGANGPDPAPAPGVTEFMPVAPGHARWDATGEDPAETARQFAVRSERCDCNEVIVEVLEQDGDHAVVQVQILGARDDSIRDIDYRVTLQQQGDLWHVTDAVAQYTCLRRVAEGGLCM